MGDTSQKILAVRGVKLELKQLDRVDLSSHPHGEIWNTFAGLFPDKIEACFPVSGINDASGGLGAFPVAAPSCSPITPTSLFSSSSAESRHKVMVVLATESLIVRIEVPGHDSSCVAGVVIQQSGNELRVKLPPFNNEALKFPQDSQPGPSPFVKRNEPVFDQQ